MSWHANIFSTQHLFLLELNFRKPFHTTNTCLLLKPTHICFHKEFWGKTVIPGIHSLTWTFKENLHTLYVSMSTYCMSSVHQFFYSRCEAEYNSNEAWFFLFDCLVWVLVFWNKISLWNSGCPRTHCEEQADLTLHQCPECWD